MASLMTKARARRTKSSAKAFMLCPHGYISYSSEWETDSFEEVKTAVCCECSDMRLAAQARVRPSS